MKFTYSLVIYATIFALQAALSTPILTKQPGQISSTQSAHESQPDEHPIHLAAFEGRVNVLRYFIEQKKIDPNIRDKHNLTPLHCAALNNQVPAIEYLIAHKADINTQDSFGSTPIHFAAIEGNVRTLKYLIEKCHVNKNTPGRDGATPLHLAAQRGHLAAVKYLIKMKCNVHACDAFGAMPIHFAALNGHTGILQHLIEVGRANNNAPGPKKHTPLHYAMLSGDVATVEYLIKMKCNVHARDINGTMPIHIAAMTGHAHILTCLIEKGHADINAFCHKKYTPLHYAALNNHLEAVKLLIKKKCKVHAQDGLGIMPIHFAALKGHIDILKALIEDGRTNKNAHGANKCTPLHHAALEGHLHAVEYLIKTGCNVHAQNSDGEMPIHFAALKGHVNILTYLIEYGHADKNASSSDNITPLHYAALKGHLHAVEYLIAQGSDINARCKDSLTPLYYAWAAQHEHVVHLITGLALTRDKDGMLIPVSNSHISDKMIAWKELMCEQYAGKIPSCIEDIAQESVHALGENNIFFFHTSSPQSHAGNRAFSKIGLNKHAILAGLAYKIKKLMPKPHITQKNHDPNEISFKSTIYHELCHIRAKHTTQRQLVQAVSGDNFTLSLEMEAELGAMYYLYTIDKKALFPYHINDSDHPTQREHWRYIAQLYAQLLENPEADFTIVEELAKLYLQEKNTQTRMVKNSILPIARKLHENGMLNTQEYSNICISLKRGY